MNSPTPHTMRLNRTVFAGLLTLALAAGALGIPAMADSHKTLTANLAAAGQDTAGDNKFTLTVDNTSANTQLGSLNLKPPSHITIKSNELFLETTKGTIKVENNVLQLRELSLQPSDPPVVATFSVTGDTTPGTECGWTVDAKQANNFRGTGNDVEVDAAGSNLTGDCVTLDVVEDCDSEGDCTVTVENDDMRVTVSGTLKDETEFDGEPSIFLALIDFELECGGSTFNHAPDTTLFDVSGFVEPMTVTMTIFAGAEGLDSASSYQVCFLGEAEFYDINGVLVEENEVDLVGDGTYGPALLHDCPTPDAPDYPCVLSWANDPVTGDRTIVFFVPVEDPMWR